MQAFFFFFSFPFFFFNATFFELQSIPGTSRNNRLSELLCLLRYLLSSLGSQWLGVKTAAQQAQCGGRTNKFRMWESYTPGSWGVFVAASFPGDRLTVRNDKVPGKVHAVEEGFSKLHLWHQRVYLTKAEYCRSKERK